MKYSAFILFLISVVPFTNAQTIPTSRITNWSEAGMQDSVPAYPTIIDISNHGAVKDGSASNNTAFQNAIAALGGGAGVIYFPNGTYLFDQSISLPDSVVIRGDGRIASKLLFNLNHSFQNMINIHGTVDAQIRAVTQPAPKNTRTLTLSDATGLNVGDWLIINGNDVALTTSAWAAGTVGQIFKIASINGNTVTADQDLRIDYPLSFSPQVRRIDPIEGAGIECLYMERMDSTNSQTNNIDFTDAANCWVIGVESNKTNFAHIALTESSHIVVRGNYIHHSHAYGGGGQGYGALAQYTTGDCLIENNIFEHLRHSMLLQAGANGNVYSYNYSIAPFWTEPGLPTDAAGDAVLHGNYPYLNLFEGNVVQNIVVDNSHGINGPFNTFFRNRAQSYGIFMNTNPATDSVNYVGNEVTGTGQLMGNYILNGVGHFQFANNVKGTITPAGATQLPESSLYLQSRPAYFAFNLSWPFVGMPRPFNTGQNQAQLNFTAATFTDCTRNPVSLGDGIKETEFNAKFSAYPNPSKGKVAFSYSVPNGRNLSITVTDVMGRTVDIFKLQNNTGTTIWNTGNTPPGIYLYRFSDSGQLLKSDKLILAK